MARRRNSNRRHRRGRFGFLYKLLSILAICAAIIMALTLFFRVDTVEISGEERYSEAQILKASGIKTGDNLFLLNKFNVANQLLKELPYIEEVRINRKLPDTLTIQVAECSQVMAVVQDGTAWLISPSGKIVDSCKQSEAPDAAQVDGCELLAPSVGSSLALATEYKTRQDSLIDLMTALDAADVMGEVGGIHLDDAAMLTMDYADRFTVQMPYGADYTYQLRTIQAVIGQLETNETGVIDLMTEGQAYFRQK